MRALPPRWTLTRAARSLLLWVGVRGLLLMLGVTFGLLQGLAVAVVIAVLASHDTRVLREAIFLADLGYSPHVPAATAGVTALLVEMLLALAA